MSRLRVIISLPYTILKVFYHLNKQKLFLKENIEPIINFYLENNDGTLTENDILKIKNYYGLAVPAVLGEAFCTLRGKEMSISERWVLTTQGVVTGIVDDFFDRSEISNEHIRNLICDPEQTTPQSTIESLFLDAYLKSLKYSLNRDEYMRMAIKVMNDQFDSFEQENPNIDKKRLSEITYNKGGNSVLYYRYGLNNLPDENEISALSQLGSLMQLENDLFDVFKDIQSGIRTIPNTSRSVDDLRRLYSEEIERFTVLCYKMKYPRKNIRKFLDLMIPILMRGMVCCDQYKKLEIDNKGVFNPENNSRKELICDMEKIRNFLATIMYVIRSDYIR